MVILDYASNFEQIMNRFVQYEFRDLSEKIFLNGQNQGLMGADPFTSGTPDSTMVCNS